LRNRIVILAMAGLFAACGEVPTEPSALAPDAAPAFSTTTSGDILIDDFNGPTGTWNGGYPDQFYFLQDGSILGGARELALYPGSNVTIDGSAGTLTWINTGNTPHHRIRYGSFVGAGAKVASGSSNRVASLNLALSLTDELLIDIAAVNHSPLEIWLLSGSANDPQTGNPIPASGEPFRYITQTNLPVGELRISLSSFVSVWNGQPLSAAKVGDIDGIYVGDFGHVATVFEKFAFVRGIADTDGDGVPDDQDVEPTRTNLYSWVDWQSADVATGTATGIATLADGTEITVNLRVADPDGSAPIFGYTNNGVNVGGIAGFTFHNWFSNNPSTYTSSYVLNHPGFDDDIIALAGGQESGHPLSSYVITFSPAVSDPVMAVMSLGAGGNQASYAFDRSFEILSQGPGRFGGGTSSLQGAGQTLKGNEGNGTVRFLGSYSTFSWTVPDGEIWHGVTLGVRGLADADADTDGDGVPDASDNCPADANGGQGDADGDGIGDTCDPSNDGHLDTDGDGLTNAEEVVIGTSPTNPDTDGDGVNDGADGCPLDPNCQTLDSSAPAITATVTGDLGDNGWYTSDVSVSWTVTDAESDYTTTGCEDASVTSDTDGVTFTCEATSAGGTDSQSVFIKRDATAPTVSVALGGTLHNGWYNTDVAVDWTTADNLSGIASDTCLDNTVATDGTHSQACAVTDNAGNSAAGATGEFKRDATDPTVTYSGNAGSYDIAGSVAITCAATDDLSGIDSDTCADLSGAAYTFGLGTTAFSASAEDVAGNTGSAAGSFEVTASLDGLCALVQRFVSHNGVANSLCAKTRAAERARNDNAHDGALEAFIHEVEAQSGKKIDADDALVLITIATALIG